MTRKEFIKLCMILGVSPLLASNKNEKDLMPALFISHGSPMNIIRNNAYTNALKNVAQDIPKPKAIVVISAHWYEDKTYISNMQKQETIYDFYGFPEELYSIKYEPNGSENYTQKVKSILDKNAQFTSRGLDHGAWSVLYHMYTKQDIPTFQISMNKNLDYEEHFNIGKMLYTLRQQGVLVIGSGGSVHNLRALKRPPYNPTTDVWADEFDKFVEKSFDNKNFKALIDAKFHKYFTLAHPYDDHFVPMLYVAGLVNKNDKIVHFYKAMELGNLSMRCIKIG